VLRVTLEVNASADMTWVAITDPIPGGATILGSGLGRDSRDRHAGRKAKRRGWPAFEERSFESFRSYYEYLPKGTVTMEYTVRLNNVGDFALPPSRVEAMYAPEMFGEAPNARVKVEAADFRPSDTLILSREGEVLQRLRTDATVRRGQWVALADVSPALRRRWCSARTSAFTSTAAWTGAPPRPRPGATCGTSARAAPAPSPCSWRAARRGLAPGPRRAQRGAKAGPDRGRAGAGPRWRKDQILEAYLNLVPFRGELVGIDALSRTLFGKAAHGLDDREAAVAAALVRAPNARPALVAQRACGVLRDMSQPPRRCPRRAKGPPAAPRVPIAMRWTCSPPPRCSAAPDAASEGVAPHLARAPAGHQGRGGPCPARPHQHLRAPLQRFAVQSLQQHLRELRGRNVEDGAVWCWTTPAARCWPGWARRAR
jgi:hypothetical protein